VSFSKLPGLQTYWHPDAALRTNFWRRCSMSLHWKMTNLMCEVA
jgi:hypothetical protein